MMEPFDRVPTWLGLSGLPAAMNRAAHSPAAWAVFCRIVALDCRLHPDAPAPVEISIRDLARDCGLAPGAARKVVASLRNKAWITCFLPDNDEEGALFQVAAPLPAPMSPDEVRRANPALFPDAQAPLRYELAPDDAAEAGGGGGGDGAEDPVLQEIIDLYLNNVSMKINNLILDELRLIRRRFPIALARRVFYRAKKHGITSIGWVMKQMSRDAGGAASPKRKKPSPPEEPRSD